MTTSMPRALALGAAAGAGWGVLARIWMRLISSDPEFSWGGTLVIIGFAALLGSGVGLVAQAGRAGHSRWWTLSVVPGLVLFLSPGMLLAPCFLIGALAFARRGRIVRATGWTVGIVIPTVGSTLLVLFKPDPGTETTLDQLVTFAIGFALMAITLAWAGSHLWRPRTPRAPRTKGIGSQGSNVRAASRHADCAPLPDEQLRESGPSLRT